MQKKFKKKLIFDAWAILAFLQKEEPAAFRIKSLLEDAQKEKHEIFISLINLGEVYYNIVGKRRSEKKAKETLEELKYLPIRVVSIDKEIVFKAATLKIYYSLSYADAFAAALAQSLKACLIRGGPELSQLSHIIKIEKLKRTLKNKERKN